MSKYLSITLKIIVSFFAFASFVDDAFSITGFIKSICPIKNSCSTLEFPYWSVIVSAGIFI